MDASEAPITPIGESELPSTIVRSTESLAEPSQTLPTLQLEPATPALPLSASTSSFPAPIPRPPHHSVGSLDGLQDLDDDEFSENDVAQDADDWSEVIQEAEEQWSEEEINIMMADLKEIGMVAFIRKYYLDKGIPIRKLLMAFGVLVPQEFDQEADLLKVLKMACGRILRRRAKLPQYNTLEDAIRLIHGAKKIMVLCGAGVSTSCGIPDFRSANGIYANLKRTRDDLLDPQEMFDIDFFRNDPTIFYSFAKELYPSNFKPSPSHRFVKTLEDKQKLLRNYTQNIDTLEQQTGIKKVLNCHGSFATAACINCGYKVPGDHIKADIFAQTVPLCPVCVTTAEYVEFQQERLERQKPKIHPNKKQKMSFSEAWDDADSEEEEEDFNEWLGMPVMKPTITFFGEKLSDEFDKCLIKDRDEVDLLLVLGTSLRVAPVSEIIGHLPHSVPQILINRDPVPHANFDICLLGDSDSIVQHLCRELDKLEPGKWSSPEVATDEEEPVRVASSHVYLFQNANATHKWVKALEPRRSRSPSVGLSIPRRPSLSRQNSLVSADGSGAESDASSGSRRARAPKRYREDV